MLRWEHAGWIEARGYAINAPVQYVASEFNQVIEKKPGQRSYGMVEDRALFFLVWRAGGLFGPRKRSKSPCYERTRSIGCCCSDSRLGYESLGEIAVSGQTLFVGNAGLCNLYGLDRRPINFGRARDCVC